MSSSEQNYFFLFAMRYPVRHVVPSKNQGKRQSSSLFLILEKICKKVKGILKEIANFFTVIMSLMKVFNDFSEFRVKYELDGLFDEKICFSKSTIIFS